MRRRPTNLTNISLRTARPNGSKPQEIADIKVPGLVIRTEPSGRISYDVRKMIRGRRRKVTIGHGHDMSLAQARRVATMWLQAWEAGQDRPELVDEAPAAPPAQASGRTVKKAIEQWVFTFDRSGSTKRWSASHSRGVAGTVKCVLPKFGHRLLSDTTRADWTDIINDKQTTAPAAASLMYSHISKFLNYADSCGWSAPLLARNGKSNIAPSPAARERKLEDAELVAIWRACDELSMRQRALVRLMILTGARRDEVARITPREINFGIKRWMLPGSTQRDVASRTKNKQPHIMPLCPLAIAELEAVDCDMGRFSAFSKLKRALDQKSGVTAWRFHDFRRSMRSFFSANDVPLEHAEAALNHKGKRQGLVEVYDRHDYAPQKIRVLTMWQEHVARIVGGDGGNVIDLRSRRPSSSRAVTRAASRAGR